MWNYLTNTDSLVSDFTNQGDGTDEEVGDQVTKDLK